MPALHKPTRSGRLPARRRTSLIHSKQQRPLNRKPITIISVDPTIMWERAPLSSQDVIGGVQPFTSKPSESIADKITKLAIQWRRETGHLSSIERKVIHPAYQSIIATGKRGLPYVLRELKQHGGHWFWALHFMSGGVDFGDVQGIEDLRSKWLAWGREQGYAGLQ